jgi:hypothetical protein
MTKGGTWLLITLWSKGTFNSSWLPFYVWLSWTSFWTGCMGSVNCWPSVSGGESYVNIEYEASRAFELQNIIIQIPLPALRDPPTVNQVDGEWRLVQTWFKNFSPSAFSAGEWFPHFFFLQLLMNFHHFLFVFSDMTLGGQSWSGLLFWLTIPTGSKYLCLLSDLSNINMFLVWGASIFTFVKSWGLKAASHYHPWWRWWSETVWVIVTRL